jgi:hypothetical protein
MKAEDTKAGKMARLEMPTDLTANAAKDISGTLTVKRDPFPNLRHEIAKGLAGAALLALGAFVTMAPFTLPWK